MGSSPLEVRSAVHQDQSEQYVLISLIAFAATILVTRLFLELTGYPRIETGTLHIAHVIWGGLFLFAGALLPLIFANRWALFWSALFSGIGFGLFMDEVGKFITQTNDYFYPPAAPIIYGLILLVAFIYLRVRRPRPLTPREEFYQIFHRMEELLDSDLDPIERQELIENLRGIQDRCDDSNLNGLANALLTFIESDKIMTKPIKHNRWNDFASRVRDRLSAFLSQNRFRWVLIAGLGWIGFNSILILSRLIIFSSNILRGLNATPFFSIADFPFINSPTWILVRFGIQGVVGIFAAIGAILFLIRKDQTAVIFATLSLSISLTVVDILIFYLDQFSAAVGAIFELTLLLLVMIYRRRFLDHLNVAVTPPAEAKMSAAISSQDLFE